METSQNIETLDTSDVDKYVGQRMGGGRLKEPVTVTEIRRWVQAVNYPNPIHFEEEAAKRTAPGEIVAPQSFIANCDVAHGCSPGVVGRIENSHVLFGGDELWFYGPRIRPGDKISVERKFDGYKIANTKFAGPTMFSRGDTVYLNQRQEMVAKQRSTIVRYRVDFARKRRFYEQTALAPEFTQAQLREFAQQKKLWVKSGESGEGPGEVKIGDKLVTRVIGPHTVASLASEHQALTFTVWGSHYYEGLYVGLDAGWIPELSANLDDLGSGAGNDEGPGSGHIHLEKAKLIGLHRHYGYGSSMGAWALDYVAYWGGDDAFIRHANIAYRSPVFEGDATLVNGEVTDVRFDPLLGVELASVKVTMTNQDGAVIAEGPVDIELRRI